jgi:hypothetical protein
MFHTLPSSSSSSVADCFLESSFTGTIKLNEEKSKHACLAQQQGIGPEFLHRMMMLKVVRDTTTRPYTSHDWLDSLICRDGLLLVVSHLFAIPILVLWVRLKKSK